MSGSGWASDAHATREPVTRPVNKKKGRLRVVQSTEQECQSDGSFLDSEHKFGLRWCAAFMVQQCLHAGFQRTEGEENGNRYCAQIEVTEASKDKPVRSLPVLFVAQVTKMQL
ncbi:hypothetical protein B0H14DRAFT_2582072 [Mycena olivaceomarginata]|nr:hypothetical protein B0H14DRAFT_2582072 [Mycena olivaceomarginata]